MRLNSKSFIHPDPTNIKEEWRQIKGYDNYMVSNWGRVKSLSFRRSGQEGIMKLVPDKRGYMHVLLSDNGIQTLFLVHRLVADAFLTNPSGKPNVIHKDRDKKNNIPYNLEYASEGEKAKFRILPTRRTFTTHQEKQIKKEYVKGGISQSALAKKYGVSQNLIWLICRRN